ncbi:MAG: hypothetical protein LUH22_12060 [Bacteroides sp.]|nr:hypothetical protein [Bacteroides sp.]
MKYLLVLLILIMISCVNKSTQQQTEIGLTADSIDFEEERPLIYYRFSDRITQAPPEDSIYTDLKVFRIKGEITILLDSIVQSVENCPKYPKERIEFVVTEQTFQKENGLYETNIHIENMMTECIMYPYYNAIFYHRGYRFVYCGPFINQFFIDTHQVLKYRCVAPDVIRDNQICEPGSSWTYNYKNGKMKLIKVISCDGEKVF